MKSNMNFEQAKERAVRYTALSRKTDYEVRRKLKQLNVDEDIISKVSEYLKQLGYIDDLAYTEAFLRQSFKMEKLSVFEMKQKLLSKGIDKELIDEKLCDYDVVDYEKRVVSRLVNGKLSSYDDDKSKSYLYRKGFRVNE